MMHGCAGPLFFALAVALVVFTSRALASAAPLSSRQPRELRPFGWPWSRACWRTCRSCSAPCCGTCRSTPSRRRSRWPCGFTCSWPPCCRCTCRCSWPGRVLRIARSVRPLAGLACAAGRADRRADCCWARRRGSSSIRCARLGGRLDSAGRLRDSGRRLAADARHHGARRRRLADLLATSLALALYALRSLLAASAVATARQLATDWRPPYESHHARPPVSSLDAPVARAGWLARCADYVELTKPRIVVLELVTVVVAAHLASPWGIDAVGAAARGARRGAGGRQCRRVQSMAGSEPPTRGWRAPPTARCRPAGSTARQVVVFGAVTLVARHGRACCCA